MPLRISSGALLAIFLAGCSQLAWFVEEPARYERPTVAVLAFENRAAFPLRWNIGDGMSDLLVDALVKTGRFTVLSRSALGGVMEELDFQQDPRFRKEGKAEPGRLKHARYLIRGSVVDFTHTAGGGLHFIRGLRYGRLSADVAVVTMTVSVIEVESREIVFSKTFAGRAWAGRGDIQGTYKGVTMGGSLFYNTPLGKASHEAISKAVLEIVETIGSVRWTPRIARIEGDRIYLSGGKDREVEVGQTFGVFQSGTPITDPATGDVIGTTGDKRIGTVRVVEVMEKMSVAERIDGEGFAVGDRLVWEK